MTNIFIDGDACPVKSEVTRVAERYHTPVVIVSNQGLRTNLGSLVRAVLVGPEFDAADNWIVDNIASNDIAVTADIQLAARCLKKGARAINPNGRAFTDDNIGSALAVRELSSYLREAGEIKGYNAPFSKEDRSRFLQALDLALRKKMNNK